MATAAPGAVEGHQPSIPETMPERKKETLPLLPAAPRLAPRAPNLGDLPGLHARRLAVGLGRNPPLDARFDAGDHRGIDAFAARDLDPLKPLEQQIPDPELAIPNLSHVLRINGHSTPRSR